MPLITLTRDQFLKRKPKGDYKAYRNYITKARAPRPHAPPTGKLVDLPMDPAAVNKALLQNVMGGALNPKQMRVEATRSVNDAIKAALGELRGTTAAAQKQATDQARAYEGFAEMLAKERRTDAGYMNDLYRDAAEDQARFAGNITGSVGAAAQADAAAQQRDVAAATGQGGYSGTDVPAMQGVGYFLGGQIPSARFSENAAYASNDMLRQGLASAARLGLEGAGMRGKAIDLQGELARERAKLIAGRAPAIREAMKGLSDDQRANLATLANVLYLQNTQAKTTADLLGTYQGQPTIDTYVDAQGRTRRYDPSQYRVKTSKNGSQFLEPLPNPPSTSTSGKDPKTGLTPSQQNTQNRMREQALQGGRQDMLKVASRTDGPLYKPQSPLEKGLRPPQRRSYAEARAHLMTTFANDLIKQFPDQKKRILQMVDETLSSAGFKKGSTPKKPPRSIVVKPGVPTLPVPGGGFQPGR